MRRTLAAVVLLATPLEVTAQQARARAETPDRAEVGTALRSAQPGIRRCSQSTRGDVNVFVTFASDGRVLEASFGLYSEAERKRVDMSFPPEDVHRPLANARPGFASSSVGRCVLAEVRNARVAPFTQARFVVQYPFVL